MIVKRLGVVIISIPFLIGLDKLTKYRIYVENVQETFCLPDLITEVPVTRKHGHIYLQWPRSSLSLFTRQELFKLHRGFLHPANDKLLNRLRLERPLEASMETTEISNDIVEHCKTFQHYRPAPVTFRASVPNDLDLVSGDNLLVDLMFLKAKAVLNVIDKATRFSSATF